MACSQTLECILATPPHFFYLPAIELSSILSLPSKNFPLSFLLPSHYQTNNAQQLLLHLRMTRTDSFFPFLFFFSFLPTVTTTLTFLSRVQPERNLTARVSYGSSLPLFSVSSTCATSIQPFDRPGSLLSFCVESLFGFRFASFSGSLSYKDRPPLSIFSHANTPHDPFPGPHARVLWLSSTLTPHGTCY